jgi:hypothetical protein
MDHGNEIKSIFQSYSNSSGELTEEDLENFRKELEPLAEKSIGKEKLDQIKVSVASKFDAPSNLSPGRSFVLEKPSV